MKRDLCSIMFAPWMLSQGLDAVMAHSNARPAYVPSTRINQPQWPQRKKGTSR